MDDADLLKRITVNPGIFGGKPIIRGRRMAVEHILGMLAAGATTEAIVNDYPYLEGDDVRACLVFARRSFSTPASRHARVRRLRRLGTT